MYLNTIQPAKGAKKAPKKLGRGIGSGLGKTCGKGHKGQKARSGGGVKAQFEGGQSPLTRRLPKRGFNNANFKKEYILIKTDYFEKDIFAEHTVITKEVLVEKGFIKSIKNQIKLLAGKTITRALTIHVDACSASARSMVEAAGGSIVQ